MNILNHHASLIIFGRHKLDEVRKKILEKITQPVTEINVDTFSIDNARFLRQLAVRKNDISVILVTVNAATVEAQNALLKILEEPSAGIHFIFLARNGNIFIPTVLSRMQLVVWKEERDGNSQARHFLAAPIESRLKIVEKVTASEHHSEAFELIEDISFSMARSPCFIKAEEKELHQLLTAHKYLSKHPVGLRSVLEHLSLSLNEIRF